MIFLQFFIRMFVQIFCFHDKNRRLVYYQETYDYIPVIEVYERDTCLKCGRKSTYLLAQYPDSNYNLRNIKERLEKKGVRNIIDIALEKQERK